MLPDLSRLRDPREFLNLLEKAFGANFVFNGPSLDDRKESKNRFDDRTPESLLRLDHLAGSNHAAKFYSTLAEYFCFAFWCFEDSDGKKSCFFRLIDFFFDETGYELPGGINQGNLEQDCFEAAKDKATGMLADRLRRWEPRKR